MKTVDDLVESAADLDATGLSHGEIADELNVSRETASWLVAQASSDASGSDARDDGARDVHVDWSEIGRDGGRLAAVGGALADLLDDRHGGVDLVVGVEKAGVPLATVVARDHDAGLAAYTPAKHRWEGGDASLDERGSFSRNFARVEGRECVVVDDTITSGTTLTETVAAVRAEGGTPTACAVLADKRGLDDVAGVPVASLLTLVSVAPDA